MKVGGRNFGWGHQFGWAGREALIARYGIGHYGTVRAHCDRFRRFVEFCKSVGIRDARHVTGEIVVGFGDYLKDLVDQDELAVSYGQNLISSINVILQSLRGDRVLTVSPSGVVGYRTHIRTEIPLYIDYEETVSRIFRMRELGFNEIAAMAWLARTVGLRFKECCLLNVAAAFKRAQKHGWILVERGTKGGRRRKITISDNRQLEALAFGAQTQGRRETIIPTQMNYQTWRNVAYGRLYSLGFRHFHDLRAAYACDRFFMETGCSAPVVSQTSTRLSVELDQKARLNISQELGHNRIDVLSAYIGGWRK
jgi:integrase